MWPDAWYIDLAESNNFREYTSNPERIRQSLPDTTKIVIIDEAQRIPEIFQEAQVMIDRNPELRLILTASSARKLRRSNINLLPGRVLQKFLHPLVSPELGEPRILERVIQGSLPGIIDSEDFREDLHSYISLYLDEEIRAEGLTRNIASFNQFLPLLALSSTEQINYTKIAQDLGVAPNTVRTYFDIVEDTLVGKRLDPYRKTKIRKAVAIPKFFLFDIGVSNALLNRFDVTPQSELFGKALEHLIFLELQAYIDYRSPLTPLNYWRTHSGLEVDFLVGEAVAIEVKASESIRDRDEKGLLMLKEEIALKERIIVCREPRMRRTDRGTLILPIEDFLQRLWDGEIIN